MSSLLSDGMQDAESLKLCHSHVGFGNGVSRQTIVHYSQLHTMSKKVGCKGLNSRHWTIFQHTKLSPKPLRIDNPELESLHCIALQHSWQRWCKMVLSSAKDATVAFLNILLPLLTPIVDVLVMKKELLFLIDQRNMCHCRSHLRSGAAKGIGAEFLAQKCAHTNNKRVMDSITA
jgi:hypothetical protein